MISMIDTFSLMIAAVPLIGVMIVLYLSRDDDD
jgi:hypothetical protein